MTFKLLVITATGYIFVPSRKQKGNEHLHFGHIIQSGAKRTHVFQIIVTLFIFNIKKNYVSTKTTCNKCSFDYLH